MLGVHPMIVVAVGSHRARPRGECYVGAYGRIDLGQPLADRCRCGCERIVSAGIKDHDVDRCAGALDSVENVVEVDTFEGNVVGALSIGVRRHQVVASAVLDAVTGKVDEAYCLLFLQLSSKIPKCRSESGAVEVLAVNNVEPERPQCIGHGLGVVYGIPERISSIGGVADYQGHSAFGYGRRILRGSSRPGSRWAGQMEGE